MVSQAKASPPEEAAMTMSILKMLFGDSPPDICVRLWDGTLWPLAGSPNATIILKHAGALRAMLAQGTELGFAEAYLRDDFDVDGDVSSLFKYSGAFGNVIKDGRSKLKLARLLMQLPSPPQVRTAGRLPADLKGRRHSASRDKQATSYHYDVSNEFYRLWLDERMAYSCAYFESGSDSLDEAQLRKLDYICRKLRLRPGQRLLDVGCGWGGLVIHAAREYGVDATGITLSQPQADLAKERIDQAGLTGRARVLVQDYREVEEHESFDAVVSVGMFEHVGLALLPKYFGQVYALLRHAGLFLNHGISLGVKSARAGKGPSFSDKYVFPDGELAPIAETLRAAGEAGFELRDLESLREHYVLTLRHWVRRLEQHHQEVLRYVDETVYRVWRAFMSGGCYGFETGGLNVYQSLMAKPDARGLTHLPLTRNDWYV